MPYDRIPPSAYPRSGEVYVGGVGSTSFLSAAPYRLIPDICATADVSTGIQVLGDSTGNGNDEWVYLVASDLVAAYPAYEVRYYLWNSTTEQMPNAPTVLHAAPNQKRHVPFAGTVGQPLTFAGSAITGDLDVRVLVELTDWNAPQSTFAANFYGNPPNRGWRFYKGAGSNTLVFDWTVNGSTIQTAAFSSTWSPPAGPVWVRVTLDVDNGASGHTITFYSSTDGETWTQVNLPTIRAGVTSINAASGPYEIGGRSMVAELLVGKMYEVQIRNGIDGPIISPILPEHWGRGSSQSPDAAGDPILSIVNGSHPGAAITNPTNNLADPTRVNKMTPNYGQRIAIISSSHNDMAAGEALRSAIAAYLAAVRGRLPGVAFCGLTQNPRTVLGIGNTVHAERRAAYIAWAQSLGWTPIDTYRAFKDDPRGLSALVTASDGIHPTPAGSRLWADVVERVLGIP